MTSMLNPSQEIAERLRGIQVGPWSDRALLAEQEFGIDPFGFEISGGSLINLTGLDLNPRDSERQAAIAEILKPHWEQRVQAVNAQRRDSLDEALGVLNLYELAIETGYLRISDVRDDARSRLVRLLWSEGARRYVRDYNFLGVAILANRVDVDLGFGPVNLPGAITGAEQRFATFLSVLRSWYEVESVNQWLGMLDDYQVIGGDQEVFAKFLAGQDASTRYGDFLLSLLSGAVEFMRSLSSLTSILSVDERPSYGTFFAYWLARFFGNSFGRNRFQHQENLRDWSECILATSLLDKASDEFLAIKEWIDDIQELWKAAADFIDLNRSVFASEQEYLVSLKIHADPNMGVVVFRQDRGKPLSVVFDGHLNEVGEITVRVRVGKYAIHNAAWGTTYIQVDEASYPELSVQLPRPKSGGELRQGMH
ncbi:hypothetical protein [Microvirga zambiensis]|uniref:hypothetical protein n=1 Tax=Microvirga zambiensis TaxID=1402137 RepID=UPI00191E378B|nr:hypothetical protein [Microvirga zambiensis]